MGKQKNFFFVYRKQINRDRWVRLTGRKKDAPTEGLASSFLKI